MLNFSIKNFVLWRTSKCRGKSRRGEGHIVVCKKEIGEKRYVISHIYKYHIPLDSIPFYCPSATFKLQLAEGHNQQPTEPSLYSILPHQLFSP